MWIIDIILEKKLKLLQKRIYLMCKLRAIKLLKNIILLLLKILIKDKEVKFKIKKIWWLLCNHHEKTKPPLISWLHMINSWITYKNSNLNGNKNFKSQKSQITSTKAQKDPNHYLKNQQSEKHHRIFIKNNH